MCYKKGHGIDYTKYYVLILKQTGFLLVPVDEWLKMQMQISPKINPTPHRLKWLALDQ